MRIFYTIILFSFFSISLNAELLKPSSAITPKEVVSIQLNALQKNNFPYKNAGIEQTWEFAHPNNKKFTGPLSNFTQMMYSKNYSILLEHIEHKIILVKKDENSSYFFIELTDKYGNKFGFQWTVIKVISNDEYNGCWMTMGVSTPMKLSESA
tara:strand:+ start:424 stop:882 length:459 start_codon:yes stop_codon:yes gene_type:complete